MITLLIILASLYLLGCLIAYPVVTKDYKNYFFAYHHNRGDVHNCIKLSLYSWYILISVLVTSRKRLNSILVVVLAFLAGGGMGVDLARKWDQKDKEIKHYYQHYQPPHYKYTTTRTGDQWIEVGDTIYGAKWRVITFSDKDTMAVVHIFQKGKLSTWINKPCNCY